MSTFDAINELQGWTDSHAITIDQLALAEPENKKDKPAEGEETESPESAVKASRQDAIDIPSAVIKVPRHERRGLLGQIVIIPEINNPYEYNARTKWLMTMVVAISAMAAPLGSGIVMPVLIDIQSDLNTSATVTNLSVALYLLSTGIFPLWWSAFSEISGRRTILIISFILFTVFAIASAKSTNIAMFLVMRLLTGGASASAQTVGAGVIADIWKTVERGHAMGMFYLGPLTGPLMAPIIGGLVGQRWGWRATQWTLAIMSGVILIFLLLCLPETVPIPHGDAVRTGAADTGAADTEAVDPRSENRADERKRLATGFKRVFRRLPHFLHFAWCFFADPLEIIKYLRYPGVLLTVFVASINYGCLYVLNISVQYIFSRPPYGFSIIIVGLLYIPNSLGYALAALLGGRWMDNIMKREASKRGEKTANGELVYRPEDRMQENAYLATVLYPIGLIWYGWTADQGVFWLAPMIANFFYGVGSMLIFSLATTMLTEFMPRRPSSGVALNNLIRNFLSCAGAIAGEPWIRAIGSGWVFTIIGPLSFLLTALAVWTMRIKGPQWRLEMNKTLT